MPSLASPFIGNERAITALRRAVASGSTQHAYLFVGPEHVGKATLATWLAQALNCDTEQPPCGECSTCTRIAESKHADVFTVTLEPTSEGSQRTAVSVDQMREVERIVALSPYEGRTRVVTIDPADGMTTQAQNAFLKTLEEPPPNVVFVLIATDEEALLPTIRSRCQRMELRLVPVSEIETALAADGADTDQARSLARLAGGRPGLAFAMAREPEYLERRSETIEQTRSLTAMPLADRMDLAEQLAGEFREDREAMIARLKEWQGWWRDVMFVQSGAPGSVRNIDMETDLAQDAESCSPKAVLTFVKALSDAREHLLANVQARLAFEALLLDAPHSATRVTPA
jgi:DNA polymerase-3 subunit delta'